MFQALAEQQRAMLQRQMNGLPSKEFCGCTLWLTGLSGAGKTTIATNIRDSLKARQVPTYLLDGDVIRQGLSSDLGFSSQDRTENIRRIAEVSRLMADAACVCIVAFISPFKKDRQFAKELHTIADLNFFEIFVDTPLEECQRRDTKGLYARAQRGEIKGLTGVDAPYETPESPDIHLRTIDQSIDDTCQIILEVLEDKDLIPVESDTASEGEPERRLKKQRRNKNKNRKKKDRR